MPALPDLSALAQLAADFERHPFGSVVLVALVGLIAWGIRSLPRREK